MGCWTWHFSREQERKTIYYLYKTYCLQDACSPMCLYLLQTMIATMPLWQAENARFALQERPFYPLKCVFTKKQRKSYPTHSTHFVWRYKSDRYAAACGQKLLTHIPPISHPQLTMAKKVAPSMEYLLAQKDEDAPQNVPTGQSAYCMVLGLLLSA